MADGVARSPSRLCSKDGKICCYGVALSTIFLLAFFGTVLPTFLIFFLHPGMVYLLRVPSSVQQPSATLSKYVFYGTYSFCLSFVPYPISELFCLFNRLIISSSTRSILLRSSTSIFFSWVLFLGWCFFVVVLSYPVR